MKRLVILIFLVGFLWINKASALYSTDPAVFNIIRGSQWKLTYNFNSVACINIIQIGNEIYSDGDNGVYLKVCDQNGWMGNLWYCEECSPMPGYRDLINIDTPCITFAIAPYWPPSDSPDEIKSYAI